MNTFEDGEERRIGQLFPPHVRAKIDTAAPKFCDGPLHLGESRLRILKRKSRQADKAVGMRPGGFRQRVVDDPGGSQTESSIRPVNHRRHERERAWIATPSA